jgi:hypothetical protein
VGAKNVIQNNANFQGTTFNHNLTGLNVLVTQLLKRKELFINKFTCENCGRKF